MPFPQLAIQIKERSTNGYLTLPIQPQNEVAGPVSVSLFFFNSINKDEWICLLYKFIIQC